MVKLLQIAAESWQTLSSLTNTSGGSAPRKGAPGITQSDLLVEGEAAVAHVHSVDLGVMELDAGKV